MSVFNTPRATSNSDTALLELVRTKNMRKNNIRDLNESAAAQAESAESMKVMEAIDAKDAADKELENEADKRRERVAKESLTRAMISLERRLYEAGCKEMFNSTIFEMAYNACWIDEPVKEATIKSMYETFNSVIETLNSVGITVNMESDSSPFIKNVRECVCEACAKASKRIVEDLCVSDKTADDINSINFNMTNGELDDMSNSLKDLGKEDIEALVKSKVLAVIQDEQRAAKEKDDEIADITAQVNSETNFDDAEKAAANESFNALVNRSRNMKAYRKVGSSLFECIMMTSTNNLRNSASTMESSVPQDVIMGAALQESILVYTIMETFNTLGLCKFDNINVNKLCNHYRTSLR